MRRPLTVMVLVGVAAAPHPARADPARWHDAEAACKAARIRDMAVAMQIVDINERGRRLSALAICEGDAARDLLTAPPAPFHPRYVLGVELGAAVQAPANGLLPRTLVGVMELSAGLHGWRRLGFEIYGATTSGFSGAGSYELDFDQNPINYRYSNHLYDVGVRMRLHADRLSFALGLGVRDDHATVSGDVAYDDSEWLGVLAGEVTVGLLVRETFTVDAVASAMLGTNAAVSDQTTQLGVRVAATL